MEVPPNFIWTEKQPFKDCAKIIPQKELKELRQQLDDLTDAGIIQTSQAIRKPPPGSKVQKSIKFCMDHYWYNRRKFPEIYNDQNIEQTLNCLAGSKCFHILGLASNLGQMPMYPGERHLPYTVRPLGFYETERMQPGYCEMLATFQVLIEYIFKDLNMVDILIFMDYIIVFGTTLEEHRLRMDKATRRLKEEDYKVTMHKSTFYLSEFPYFGHLVSEDGIAIAPEKVEAMAAWPEPKTVSELKSFLEFCGYYQHFYKDFPKLSKPLSQLLKDVVADRKKDEGVLPKIPWWTRESIEERWTKECNKAFHSLKNCIIHAPVLDRVNMTQRHPYY